MSSSAKDVFTAAVTTVIVVLFNLHGKNHHHSDVRLTTVFVTIVGLVFVAMCLFNALYGEENVKG